MVQQLTSNWWALVLRGAIAILFAIAAFVVPGITLEVLVLYFGAYMFLDGLFAVWAALTNRGANANWWMLLLEGILGILAGLIAFFRPGLTLLVLIYFIAAWAVVTGVLEVLSAIRLRREITNEWLLALGGVISVILGVLLFLFPGVGALITLWFLAAYAFLFGLLMVVLGFRLRGITETPTPTSRLSSAPR